MERAVVLKESLIRGLGDSGVKIGSLRLENLTQHLGEIVGIDLILKGIPAIDTTIEYTYQGVCLVENILVKSSDVEYSQIPEIMF